MKWDHSTLPDIQCIRGARSSCGDATKSIDLAISEAFELTPLLCIMPVFCSQKVRTFSGLYNERHARDIANQVVSRRNLKCWVESGDVAIQ